MKIKFRIWPDAKLGSDIYTIYYSVQYSPTFPVHGFSYKVKYKNSRDSKLDRHYAVAQVKRLRAECTARAKLDGVQFVS